MEIETRSSSVGGYASPSRIKKTAADIFQLVFKPLMGIGPFLRLSTKVQESAPAIFLLMKIIGIQFHER